ncbi:AT-rich interactive domain-containing protein 2, partial [Mucuna pruriens]
MGYKRCLEANEFEDRSLNKAKRFECNNELVSLADVVTPNKALANTVITGDDEDGIYNIQWYDPLVTDATKESLCTGNKNVETSGHFSSCSSEDDTGSGATSLSSASSGCLEFDIPQKAFVPLDDDYLAFDCSPRKPVPIGPNHQATIPVWRGKVNKMTELVLYNHDSPSSGLVSAHTVDKDEERLMGTSVLSMHESSFYSSTSDDCGQGRTECNCIDRGSIRCVRQHVREARENLKETLWMENFRKLGLCDMGEEVAQQWTEEEEDMFHEVVYSNPASLGRNFWKHLSVTFHSRTNKEIVSYYFNVFMLRRRAAQNRSRVLDIDSDDDECHTRNPGIFGFENSEDDSAIESLGDQDVRVENQDNYSDEDNNSDDGTEDDVLGLTGCDMGNTTEIEGEIDQGSSNCKVNSQIETWSNLNETVNVTSGILNYNIVVQDDSCMSYECDANMDVSCHSHSHVLGDASSALQARGFRCDQSPHMQGKLDLSSNEMEHVYLMEPCVAKDWYPGYSICPTPSTDLDFLPTSNLIEEFFGHGTLDKKTRSD